MYCHLHLTKMSRQCILDLHGGRNQHSRVLAVVRLWGGSLQRRKTAHKLLCFWLFSFVLPPLANFIQQRSRKAKDSAQRLLIWQVFFGIGLRRCAVSAVGMQWHLFCKTLTQKGLAGQWRSGISTTRGSCCVRCLLTEKIGLPNDGSQFPSFLSLRDCLPWSWTQVRQIPGETFCFLHQTFVVSQKPKVEKATSKSLLRQEMLSVDATSSQTERKQVRLVSIKAERPHHPTRSHARQGGGG